MAAFLTRRLKPSAITGASGALRFPSCAAIGYFDTAEPLTVRDCNAGGGSKNLILQADLVLRADMFRLQGRAHSPTYSNVNIGVLSNTRLI